MPARRGHRRRTAWALLALPLVAACARDVELPPPPAGPQLVSVTPARAFGGQRVVIAGSGFDLEAGGNVVAFANASARAEQASAGRIVVRVPPDAGTGPLTVTTRRGTSAPLEGFVDAGPGQPRLLRVANEEPLLHRPDGVLAVNGRVLLRSTLLDELVLHGAPSFEAGGAYAAVRVPGTDAVVYARASGAGDETVLGRVDLATGARLERVAAPGTDLAELVTAGADRVALCRDTGMGVEISVFDAATLAPAREPALVTGVFLPAWADAGEGRLAALGLRDDLADPHFGEIGLGIVDLAAEAPAPSWIEGAPPELAWGELAVGGPSGARFAIAPGWDGSILVADLDGAPGFRAPVPTYTPSVPAALGIAANVVLATKPEDGLVIAVSLDPAEVTFAIDVPEPGPIAIEGDVAYVASGGENTVTVVDASHGTKVGELRFDLLAGDLGEPVQTVAYLPGGGLASDTLLFGTGQPHGALEFRIGDENFESSFRWAGAELTRFAATAGCAWGAGAGGAASSCFREGADAGAVALHRIVGIPGADVAVAASDAGLVVLAADGVQDEAALPGTSLVHLGLAAEGTVLAAGTIGGTERVQLWTLAGLAAESPLAEWTAPAGVVLETAVVVEDGIHVLYDDDGGVPRAMPLGPGLEAGAPFDHLVRGRLVAVSPNARVLVAWEPGWISPRGTLRFHLADAASGFPPLGFVELEGELAGAAFDAGGGRLFAVTRTPDRLVVVE